MRTLEAKSAVTTVAFLGDAVHQILGNNPEMLAAVWSLCTGMLDATIKCHVFPRLSDMEALVWSLDISSPIGRRSVAVTQRKAAGQVSFTNQ